MPENQKNVLKHSSMAARDQGPQAGPEPSSRTDATRRAAFRRRAVVMAALTLVLIFGYNRPLSQLAAYASQSELYDYNLLIPFVSGYLIWLKRKTLPLEVQSSPRGAWLAWLVSFGLVAGYWMTVRNGWQPNMENYLSLMISSFLLSLLGVALICVGPKVLRPVLFPVALLIFMAPFPSVVHDWIEKALQLGSANTAHAFFWLSGMPVFRQGTAFQLPGVNLDVAPECSGIHSSVVLFFTSMIAGHLFLRSAWKRTVLTLFVIPVAIVRNGFRVYFIAQLCIQISPDMLNSSIHKRGGPIFFGLSLIPFFLLLVLLRRSELGQPARARAKRALQPKRYS